MPDTKLAPNIVDIMNRAVAGQPISHSEFMALQQAAANLPPMDPDFKAIAVAVQKAKTSATGPTGVSLPGGQASPVAANPIQPSPPQSPGDILGNLAGSIAGNIPLPGGSTARDILGLGQPQLPFGGISHAMDQTGPNMPPPHAAASPSNDPLAILQHLISNPSNVGAAEIGAANPAVGPFAINPGAPGTGPATGTGGPPPPFTPTGVTSFADLLQNPRAYGGPQGRIGGANAIDPTDYSSYTFGQNPGSLDTIMNDPEGAAIEALALAKQRGGAINTASALTPYVQAAMQLAPTGALGADQGNDLVGGPASNQQTMKAVEDFLNMQNQPGMDVNPGTLMQNVLERAQNTSPAAAQELMKSLGMGDVTEQQLSSADTMIKVTNAEMAAVGAWMTPQAKDSLNKLLAMADINYKKGVADGSIQMTYPQFLQRMGLAQWFGAQSSAG